MFAKKDLFTETNRLLIRNFVKTDVDDYFEYLSDPTVVFYEPYKTQTYEQVEKIVTEDMNSNEMLALELKANNKMIGNIYIGNLKQSTDTLGYVLNPDYCNQGLAKEACKAIVEKLFKLGIHRIEAKCDPKNISSWKLLESIGFKRECHLKKNVYFWKDEKGIPIWKDTYIYSLLNK